MDIISKNKEKVITSLPEGESAVNEIYHIASRKQLKQLKTISTIEGVEQFLLNFWKPLDPTPDTQRNELREIIIQRNHKADQRFNFGKKDGRMTDRGRVLVLYGEPENIEYSVYNDTHMIFSHSPDMTYDIEIWYYPFISSGTMVPGVFQLLPHSGTIFIFADLYGSGDFIQIFSSKRGERIDTRINSVK